MSQSMKGTSLARRRGRQVRYPAVACLLTARARNQFEQQARFSARLLIA
jgi:hypothetical protein